MSNLVSGRMFEKLLNILASTLDTQQIPHIVPPSLSTGAGATELSELIQFGSGGNYGITCALLVVHMPRRQINRTLALTS